MDNGILIFLSFILLLSFVIGGFAVLHARICALERADSYKAQLLGALHVNTLILQETLKQHGITLSQPFAERAKPLGVASDFGSRWTLKRGGDDTLQ